MFQVEYEDNPITKVSPYSIPDTNNEKLLSILKPIPSLDRSNFSSRAVTNNFSIPIAKHIDILNLIENNNTKISNCNNSNLNKQVNEINSNVTNGLLNNNNGNEVFDQNLSRFIELENFLPTNLQQQLSTIIIKDFPNFKKVTIEKILQRLITNNDFNWSIISYEFIDNKLVFVRFKTIEQLKWFISNYSNDVKEILNNQEIEIIIDSSLVQYLDENYCDGNKLNDLSKMKIKNEINQVLNHSKKYEKISTKTGTEDLDEVLNYYSNYKIDYNELIDVPNNMKETIIKDIIKFRSKVLTIEKNHRKNEIEIERMKAKQRLKQIFEGIKEVNDEIITGEDETNQSLNTADVDEFEELNDEEYENFLNKKQQEEIEAKFNEKLTYQTNREKFEKQQLIDKLKSLNNYENNLIENKFKFMEEIKNFKEFSNLYYLNHSEYNKLRNKQRSLEETNDLIDTKEEEKELESLNKVASSANAFVIPTKPTTQVAGNHNYNNEFSNLIISKFSNERIDKINQKIVELIEEYLGIKDEFLINLVMEFLLQHNLNEKDELISELSEPLDDDSINLVNDLWKFILKLSNDE